MRTIGNMFSSLSTTFTNIKIKAKKLVIPTVWLITLVIIILVLYFAINKNHKTFKKIWLIVFLAVLFIKTPEKYEVPFILLFLFL